MCLAVDFTINLEPNKPFYNEFPHAQKGILGFKYSSTIGYIISGTRKIF
jgi:hypothetical protein